MSYICSCYLCNSPFALVEELSQHLNSPTHPTCAICFSRLVDQASLERHHIARHLTTPPTPLTPSESSRSTPRSTPHVQFACGDCGRAFDREGQLDSHRIKKRHGPNYLRCTDPLCDIKTGFLSAADLKAHQSIKRHGPNYPASCKVCKRRFKTEASMKDHFNARHGDMPSGKQKANPCRSRTNVPKAAQTETTYKCLECDREFKLAEGLKFHLEYSQVHKQRPVTKPVGPNSCEICSKEFISAAALKRHKKSTAHKPITPGLECLRPGCGRKFSSPSAMLHHLESGGCSPEITRQTINALILEHDHASVITDKSLRDPEAQQIALLDPKRNLALEGSTTSSYASSQADTLEAESLAQFSDDESDAGVILTPHSPADSNLETLETMLSNFPTTLEVTALVNTPRPKTFTCPHCPSTRPPFHSAKSLHFHLSSAAHAPKVFHCPISLFADDDKGSKKKKRHLARFSTLSGLTQHLESEACKGGNNTFIKAVKIVEETLRGLGIDSRALKVLAEGQASS